MQHIEVERHFDAPPQAVWDVYTDHARWKEWAGFSGSFLETQGSPEPNGSGAVRVFGTGGMNAYEEVLEFEPPKRMTYTIQRGGLPMKNHLGEVVLEPEGDGTRLVWRCRFDSKIPGLGVPLRLFVSRFFSKALDGLASHSFPDRR